MAGFSSGSQLKTVLLVMGIIGGGFYGLQQGVNCGLKDVSIEKPGGDTIQIRNTGVIGLTAEVMKTSYDGGVFDFVGSDEQYVSIGAGETADIELGDNQIMKYRISSCEAKSGLARYGEIDPYDGGPDVSDALERYR